MKRIFTVLLVVLIASAQLCFSACSGKGSLDVMSYDYQGLVKMEQNDIDLDYIWQNFTGHYCGVSLENEKLVISRPDINKRSYTMMGNYGYFVGVDLGEFDGWVRFFPYDGDDTEPLLVVDENCRGFVERGQGKGELLLTGLAHMGLNEGALYKLYLVDKQWHWEKLCDLGSSPNAYFYNKDTGILYIVTDMAILAYTEEDGLETLLKNEDLGYMYPNSLVELDGKLYVGMALGVYEYDLGNGSTSWYTLDLDYVEKKK